MVDVLLAVQRDRTVLHLKLARTALVDVAARFRRLAQAFLANKRRVRYSPAYTPEADEILFLENYPLPAALSACARVLPRALGIVTKDTLRAAPPHAFVLVETGENPKFIFQTITSANRLESKGAVLFGDGDFVLNEDAGLLLAHRINAVVQAGELLFTSEHTVRHFLNMEVYFREVSNESIDSFFGDDGTFEVTDMGMLKAAANQVIRRKLQHVIDNGNLPSPKAIQKAAKKHLGLALVIRDDRLVVPTDAKAFGQFVRLLNHDYVQSLADEGARFVASSKRPLRSGGE